MPQCVTDNDGWKCQQLVVLHYHIPIGFLTLSENTNIIRIWYPTASVSTLDQDPIKYLIFVGLHIVGITECPLKKLLCLIRHTFF